MSAGTDALTDEQVRKITDRAVEKIIDEIETVAGRLYTEDEWESVSDSLGAEIESALGFAPAPSGDPQ
jgi:hypothetical protein